MGHYNFWLLYGLLQQNRVADAKAVLAKANGKTGQALEYARDASRKEGEMPYAFGPPFVDYPSAQLLGELELENGNNEKAALAFTGQLKRSRGKRLALDGLQEATSSQQ